MAKKTPEIEQRGLGDLTNILHNQGVSDLSWLAVDEEDYKASCAVPKQNLDIIPEFQKALLEDPDDGVPRLVPLRPHTIVNGNPLDAPQPSQRDFAAPIRNRVARLVMAGLSPKAVTERLGLEFPESVVAQHASVVNEVLYERGLLGNVYIDASHFPRAASDPREKKLAALLGKSAKYVIGGCGGKNGCNCHQTGLCSTFGGKRVVKEVPYGPKLAAQYAQQLAREGRRIDASSSKGLPVGVREWKERLRAAFLQPARQLRADPVQTVQHQDRPAVPKVSSQDVARFLERRQVVGEAAPKPQYLKYARRMMQGHDDRAALSAALEPELRALAKEYGILGHTYLDVDALGGCRKALEFVRARAASADPDSPASVEAILPDFFLRRDAHCSICKGAPDGACSQLCKLGSMVHSRPDVGQHEFAVALRRAAVQGRITVAQCESALAKAPSGSNWTGLTAQANLIKAPVRTAREYSGAAISAHYGTRVGGELGRVQVDPEDVRRHVSHLMNGGLSGKPLQQAVLRAFSRGDLAQIPEIGRHLAAEEGVQGSYFIDPTAYKDYGRGCEEGSRYFRKRGAPNVLASDGCTGCVLQTAPGWCSKYSKAMIRNVPQEVRHAAAQRRRLPIVQPSAPPQDPSQKYELSSDLTVDVNGSKSRAIDVTIGGPSLDD